MNARSTTAPVDARSWGYAEDFVPASDHLRQAREAALDLGLDALGGGTASVLTFLAKVITAKAVAEVGTGTGVSGLALFAGMARDGILTSIDPEAERQTEARRAFVAAGIPNRRFRLIAGAPLDVLPKLQDGAYDIVVINGDKLEYVEYVAQSLRLLRHGGLVVINDALWRNLVADPANEDDETVIIREALQAVSETEEFTATLLPVGGGLLLAVKD